MIANEGWPFVGIATGVALVAIYWGGGYGVLALILPGFVAYFFRDPRRLIPADDNLLVSPADGKIIEVSEVEETRYLKRRAKKIVIFLSIFNVHINRVPCSGEIREVNYHPGKFLIGFHEKASLDNEQNGVVLRTNGKELAFVQIAGFIARRIVCYLKKGQTVKRGERFGLIRFGSRMDLYLPLDLKIAVKVGDRVTGGESILARFA